MTPDTKPQKCSKVEQNDLDDRLIEAAATGDTQTVQMLLALGADVHAWNDEALRWAAENGHLATLRKLLAYHANVHARNDWALRFAIGNGDTETVRVLAEYIFAPESWRGKNRAEIEAEANVLYDKIKADSPSPEQMRTAGGILIDCALCCWEQVRPAPPKLNISPLPTQPRAL